MTVLAILSIVATLIAAWPPLQTAFARVPKVYYAVRSESVSLPPAANEVQVMIALKAAGLRACWA